MKPISKYTEFIDILDESIAKRTVGDVDILRNFIRHDRRIISEDIPGFENELKANITSEHIQSCRYVRLRQPAIPNNTK